MNSAGGLRVWLQYCWGLRWAVCSMMFPFSAVGEGLCCSKKYGKYPILLGNIPYFESVDLERA